MELSGSYINLHNSSRKLFSEEIFVQRHLLCMQQFHSISHNSGRNVYPCEFEIPVCIINRCVLSERIKHEIALCKGIHPWIPDSRCWIPLFVSRAWILDPNRLCLLDSLNFPIPVTKIIPDSGFQNQKFAGLCYPLKIFHLSIHWEGMDIFWNETFQNSDSLTWRANQAIIMQSLLTKRKVKIVVYSYFEKVCQKKCTRQSCKALWVVLSSLFFREI